jgi:hypothetical protein
MSTKENPARRAHDIEFIFRLCKESVVRKQQGHGIGQNSME